jgi:nucleotide-binding universal stress UspA family protein
MKTILVLTDLTKKSENAALYALKLAERMDANILLYHSFKVFQTIAMAETGIWPAEDYSVIENECITELKKLADRLCKHHQPGNFKPAINVFCETGDLGSRVTSIVDDKNISLVIMGAKGDDVLSHILFGSDTSNVLDEVKCPILFVPDQCHFTPYKTIVFSTDLKKAYPKAVSFLVELATLKNSDIIITHIGEGGNFSPIQILDLVKNVFEYPSASFRQIPQGNISEQLNKFTNFVQADLAVMIHHQHTLLGEMIPGSSSKKMLYNHKVPLLILPD